MAKLTNVFNGVAGLNTKVSPSRLGSENGIVELAEAVNIDISDRFKPKRRKGQLSTSITSPIHSIKDVGNFALCVSLDTLYKMSASFTLSSLRTGLTLDAEMSYAEQAGKMFYANGYEKGYVDISEGSDNTWIATQDRWQSVESSRRFSSPPVGHILAPFAGRVWIAQDNVLWCTQPFAPMLVDMARNAIPFDSRLKALIPVADGIFVSTTRKIVFLRGTKLEEMMQIPVAEYPAIPGTVAITDAQDVAGVQQAGVTGQVAIMTTQQGICVAGNGGFFQNLTKRKLDMPLATSGCAYIYDRKYVVNLKT